MTGTIWRFLLFAHNFFPLAFRFLRLSFFGTDNSMGILIFFCFLPSYFSTLHCEGVLGNNFYFHGKYGLTLLPPKGGILALGILATHTYSPTFYLLTCCALLWKKKEMAYLPLASCTALQTFALSFVEIGPSIFHFMYVQIWQNPDDGDAPINSRTHHDLFPQNYAYCSRSHGFHGFTTPHAYWRFRPTIWRSPYMTMERYPRMHFAETRRMGTSTGFFEIFTTTTSNWRKILRLNSFLICSHNCI